MQNRAVIWKTSLRFCCVPVLSSVTDGKICDRCVWVRVKERASACLFFPKLSHLRCCFSPVVSLHSLQYTSLPVLSLCVSLSLPVSCALFQGWGLRHAFHLAYEALILFRAWREREKDGRREGERCGGWMGGMRATSLPSLLPEVCTFVSLLSRKTRMSRCSVCVLPVYLSGISAAQTRTHAPNTPPIPTPFFLNQHADVIWWNKMRKTVCTHARTYARAHTLLKGHVLGNIRAKH